VAAARLARRRAVALVPFNDRVRRDRPGKETVRLLVGRSYRVVIRSRCSRRGLPRPGRRPSRGTMHKSPARGADRRDHRPVGAPFFRGEVHELQPDRRDVSGVGSRASLCVRGERPACAAGTGRRGGRVVGADRCRTALATTTVLAGRGRPGGRKKGSSHRSDAARGTWARMSSPGGSRSSAAHPHMQGREGTARIRPARPAPSTSPTRPYVELGRPALRRRGEGSDRWSETLDGPYAGPAERAAISAGWRSRWPSHDGSGAQGGKRRKAALDVGKRQEVLESDRRPRADRVPDRAGGDARRKEGRKGQAGASGPAVVGGPFPVRACLQEGRGRKNGEENGGTILAPSFSGDCAGLLSLLFPLFFSPPTFSSTGKGREGE